MAAMRLIMHGIRLATLAILLCAFAIGQNALPPTDVLSYRYNSSRQGQNTKETILKPSNVNSASFGKLLYLGTDGKVDAQPLYVTVGPKHLLIVVTEHGSAYAFDADTGVQSWKVTTIASGETPSDDRGCDQITPEIGVTATPVIDRQSALRGVVYLVAMSKDSGGSYHQRLHALDLKTGTELFGGPKEISASYGHQVFDAKQYKERAALLEVNSVIYLTFASHCDGGTYSGWVLGYNANTLAQSAVLNLTPNGSDGAIWMSGDGPAADAQGNIYLLDGNGTFDTTLDGNGFPINGDFGNAFIKISTSQGLAVSDYFTMYNTVEESNNDLDLGSGGVILLPDLYDNNGQVHHLAIGSGKDSNIYVVNRDNMGKFNPNNDNAIYQELDGAIPGDLWSTPAYWNNTVYFGESGSSIKAFPIANAKLTPFTSQTRTGFPYPGTSPTISSNGTANAILWGVEYGATAVLHAYDANNLATEFYNSNQSGSRDQFGAGSKFVPALVVNGKVFVASKTGVAVFGLF